MLNTTETPYLYFILTYLEIIIEVLKMILVINAKAIPILTGTKIESDRLIKSVSIEKTFNLFMKINDG